MAKSRRLVTQKKKTAKNDLEQVASLYVQARAALIRAGRTLHDHVGSSLSAAGVQLQLLRMDVPAAQARVDETLRILEESLDRIRDLCNDLCPSPSYRGGLKQALLRLADQYGSNGCQVVVEYSATAAVPAEIAAALYEAGCAVVEQARQKGAARVSITVRGTAPLVLRIADNGRKSGRVRALSAIRTLAHAQGLAFECTTGKSTIVSIRYAVRRTPRG
jgi:nitrate/nitrite-specific signal transduction histidine kinase